MSRPQGQERIFVYGTLRRGTEGSQATLLRGRARWVGRGAFRGRLYQVSYFPGAVADPESSEWVIGEVYVLDYPEEVLRDLDDYEDCGPAGPEPPPFKRTLQTILLEGRDEVVAWVYLFNWQTNGLRRIPSGDFLNPGDPVS